ncbi:HlyD family secretion protein [Deltaproteobacteria bacterium]|nr:HlyD family secretion protein [Deltaproteobacteria bacterium]
MKINYEEISVIVKDKVIYFIGFIEDKMPDFIKDKTPDIIKSRVTDFVKRKPLTFIVVLVFIAFLGLWGLSSLGEDDIDSSTPIFVVKRGPLKISVTETGTIEAREKIIVKNEVEGQTSIIYLVDEGTNVKKGDLLIELDSSTLLDKQVDLESQVESAEASFINARENLEVIKNQAQSDIDQAQLSYDFAVLDEEKYLEGEYPNKLKELEAKITLAEEEVANAKEELDWSRKLYEEKYISQTELQSDELAEKKKTLDLELARNDLDLFVNFTHKRSLTQLESDVKESEMALQRTTIKANAEVIQGESTLRTKESEYKRQQDKLKKNETQLEKTKLYAPADGLVIYATSAGGGGMRFRREEPLELGSSVRERQELIHLPTSSGYNAEISVLESSLDKVSIGLPVLVTVDTLPDETYTGRVATVAPVPDAMSSFMNPDLKVYDTVIELDNGGEMELLRTGMSCKAEIVVKQHTEATYVPVQAVINVGGKPTVYVVKGKKTEPRKVEIGMDNNIVIVINEGLKPGEVVSLSPPLEEAALTENGFDTISELPSATQVDETIPAVTEMGGVQDSGQDSSRMGVSDPGIDSSQGGRSSSAGGFMQRLDTDGDGSVSKEEFAGSDEMFTRFDSDGDGYISESEVPQRPSGAPSGGGGMSQDSGVPSGTGGQDLGFQEGDRSQGTGFPGGGGGQDSGLSGGGR